MMSADAHENNVSSGETDESKAEAVYQLETAVICPSCSNAVNSLKVIRMLRTRVNFTSTLPRRGRAIACPACSVVLSAEIGALG